MHWESAWEAHVSDQHDWAEVLSACELLVLAHPWSSLLSQRQREAAAETLAIDTLLGSGCLSIERAIAQQQRSAA